MAEAVIFFLRKLSEQLKEEGEVLSGVHEEIEWIKSELEAMVAFLTDVHRMQRRDERIGRWAAEVSELVYDAEDIIDEFLIRREKHRWNFIKYLQSRHRVSSQIQKIKKRVMEVKERRDRYDWSQNVQENTPGVMGPSSTGFGAATPYFRADDIVGIEDHVEQLIELLSEGKPDRHQVISVFGMGGLGKTTLIKEVYKRVKANFDCFSWVFLSQSCNLRDILQRILFGLKESRNEPAMAVMDVMNEGLLQEMIYKYLQNKTYLIVLDDIWDKDIWEELKYALPRERDKRVCILLTTRIQDIASGVEDGCFIYHLQPLAYDLAWELFCIRAFRRNKACPEDLRGLAESIVRKCEGLPLAIVAIAGLLSSKSSNAPEWQHALDTLDWELNHDRDLDRLHKTLLFSYHHLPFYLRHCFLHISLFPEDYEIGRKRLIRMWVAEGFVEKSRKKTEEVANHYFLKLVRGSMIQSIALPARDVIKACRVHDKMRDVALDMLKQEMFGATLAAGDKEMEGRPRRLSIYDNAENLPSSIGNFRLRSFLMFGIAELSSSDLLRIFEELKLLRVLDLQGVPIESLPDEVGSLIHLRYLNLRGTLIKCLPKQLKSLRNLQTLDIRNTNITRLPTGINKLQQLRHLHITSFSDREKGFLKMPKGGKSFKNLQTLSGVELDEDLLKELRSLTNLRKFYVGGMTKTNSEELWVSVRQMKSLRSFTVVADGSPEQLGAESLSCRPPPSLEKLKLQVPIKRLPECFVSLTNLHTLYLLKNFLVEDPFPILQQLPNLLVLVLASSAFLSKSICCRSGGFPKLVLLRILDMENWMEWMPIEDGTLPNLRYLLIADCRRLLRLPQGFHHLKALQSLTLIRMCPFLSFRLQGVDHWKVQHIKEISVIS